MADSQPAIDSDDAVDWRPSAPLRTLTRRAALLAELRAFMFQRGVCEVDTPLLARATPAERGLDCFALGDAGHLVPSPEHAMKRLLAHGAGPIYQLGHVFRAGEAGRWHNPEFCMLEWYRPGADMAAMIEETAALIQRVGGPACAPTRDYATLFEAVVGLDPLAASAAELAEAAATHDVAPYRGDAGAGRAFWLDLLMSLVVQPRLGHDAPVCITGFPIDDAVLVAGDPVDARKAMRFEFYWRGVELANGAQELCDAGVARERMTREDAARRSAGQAPGVIDRRLLAAMDHGLPRCAGVALGVDRLLALTLGCERLADVLSFDWPLR